MTELVQELFFTALVAIIFSFLVAKLVSIVLCTDDVERGSGLKSSKVLGEETVVEEVKLDKGLIVEDAESSREVHFVEDVLEKVDEFKGKGSVDELGVSSSQANELVNKCDVADGTEVGKNLSGVIELQETSSEGRGVDEVVEKTASEFEVEVNRKGQIGADLIKMDVGKSENLRDDGVKEEKMVTGCLDDLGDEEKIENEEKGDNEIDVELTSDGSLLHQIEKDGPVESVKNRVVEIEGQLDKEENEKMRLVSDEDDDWEGIERSELEKAFAKAADFVNSGGSDGRLSNVGSDVQMQLYGLQKVAMEGPCHEPQPMALKVSARARWNAWQRLGSMSPEMAMELYISLLSDKVPGWMQRDFAGDDKPDSSKTAVASDSDPNISTSYLEVHENFEKKMETESGFGGGGLTGSSSPPKKDPA